MAVAVAGSVAVAFTTGLPWARSGQTTRTGWALAGAVHRLGLAGTGALRLLLIAFLATPVLAAGAWIAAFANRPAIVATLAGSSGLVAASAWVALRVSPLDARVGAHLALVSGGVALLGAVTLGVPAWCPDREEGAMTEDAAWMRPDGDLGAYVASPEPPPPPRRKRGATIAIAAGAAVAVVAGVLAVATINSNGGGGTPEAAVQKLFDALDHEDALGALDALLPAERDVVGDRLTKITSELGRLGVLSDNLDLSHIPGGDISFEGLKYQSQALADDVAVVSVTGDKLSLAITAKDLPLGSLTRPMAAGGITSPDPAAPIAVRMVAIRDGGDWYVSLGHSIAEDIRKDSDFGEPDFAKAVQPRGESSPEAAVREMARAAADLDVRRLVELAPPGEGAALHDYAPLFLDGVEQYAKAAKAGGPLFTIDALDLTTKGSGDEARVVVDKLEVTENTAGARSSFGTDGRCLHYQDAGQNEPTKLCPDDPELVGEFGRTSFQPLALTTVNEGGSWYVSPVRTELDSLLEMLKATTTDELAKAVADSGPGALYPMLNPVPFEFFLLFERAAIGSSSEEESPGSCVVASPQVSGNCMQAVTPPATVVETIPPLPLPTTTTVP